MLAQTELLCATIWLAYHPVSTAFEVPTKVLRQALVLGLRTKDQSDADRGSFRPVKKYDRRVERGRAR